MTNPTSAQLKKGIMCTQKGRSCTFFVLLIDGKLWAMQCEGEHEPFQPLRDFYDDAAFHALMLLELTTGKLIPRATIREWSAEVAGEVGLASA